MQCRLREPPLKKARSMNPDDYSVEISHLAEEDGGGYLAIVPELPGCMSDGESPEEAMKNVRDAIAAWIATATEMGRTIPRPRLVHA